MNRKKTGDQNNDTIPAVYAWITCFPGGARLGSSKDGIDTTITFPGESIGEFQSRQT